MALSLINPSSSDFLRNWPAQNAVNCDAIDAFAGPCLTTNALQTYTPSFTATITNPYVGDTGSLIGYYYRIFDQVFAWGEFRFGGTGRTAGSGAYMISLPFPAKTITPPDIGSGGSPVLGNGLIWDDSTVAGRIPVICGLRTETEIHFSIKMDSGAAGRLVTNTSIVWAEPDGMDWFVKYQRQP